MAAKEVVQYSLRINESLRDEVKFVSEHVAVSMNQLIVDAIRAYLPIKRKKIQQELTESLRLLKQYSDRDPKFDEAIREFAAAEVSGENPVEGSFFDVRDGGETATDASQAQKTKMLEDFLTGA